MDGATGMSMLPVLANGGRVHRHERLHTPTSITNTTRNPILTTLNRAASRNRMGRLTRMGRIPRMAILIRPTCPTRQTFLRRLT